MDFSGLANPYDFANPVSDPALFAGRSDEINDVRYYLDHASKAGRAINLAIMGARASGKTSFLNIMELEATKRGFCVVRVDLDEADVQTEIALFCKLFDALITTVMEHGAFGGIAGKTYDTYRDMMDAYVVPEDKTFCPFIFPIQYAKAMGKGNAQASLSDTGFKRDLRCVNEELGRPIAILFDECDVLAKSRIHLEKLRNIFMNTSGYMLVLTGTPALFPVMDEVFSPIVRQFKKINIRPFDDEDETKTCIIKPLEKLGIKHVSEILDFETYYDISEIHNLSSGRPYEIQLICHFLFRRIQQNRAKRMELTLDVLDDVLTELHAAHDVSTRGMLSSVRELDKKQLTALGLLCRCDGRASLDQLWFAEYVTHGNSRWTRTDLEHHLAAMIEMKIVTVEDGTIRFLGDDFDRVYCKYLARKYGVHLSIADIPYEVALAIGIDESARQHAKDLQIFPHILSFGAEEVNLRSVAESLLMVRDWQARRDDPLESTPDLAEVIYWSSLDFQEYGRFPVVSVNVASTGARFRRWYGCRSPSTCESDQDLIHGFERLRLTFEEAAVRARDLGGDLQVQVEVVPAAPIAILREWVLNSDNQRMREGFAIGHIHRMIEAYTELHDLPKAKFHGDLAYSYHSRLSGMSANNLGYLNMVLDDLERARELLGLAIETAEDDSERALPTYNSGVVEAISGHYQGALERFNEVIQLLADEDEDSRTMACLLVPALNLKLGRLEYPEVQSPDLLQSAKSACRAVEQMMLGDAGDGD